jgi:hypothetical protein
MTQSGSGKVLSMAEPPSAVDRSIETRFKAHNSAARRHGLRAGTRTELRRRDRRTSRLFGQYLRLRADDGRPLGPTQLPIARRFCELEIMARDLYAAWTQKPNNGKLHQQYISTIRAQALISSQLGESVATMARLTKDADGAGQAHRELLELYRPKELKP